jgi:nucleotide-binding universal stress UspA family protein
MGEKAFRHVLAPTDFSEPSAAALAYAVNLAEAFDAQLTILHVIEPDFETGALSYGIQPDLARYVEKAQKVAMDKLEAWAKRVSECDVEILLKRGTASVEIVRTAVEDECDVIVIGTHGRTGFRDLIFGSTAERVVRKAHCPVLTVRDDEPGHEEG